MDEKKENVGGLKMRWIISIAFLILVIVLALIGKMSFGGSPEQISLEPAEKSYYAVFPVELPDTLYFAGERIPMHLFDVRESLDREVLSNTFFHSQSIRLIKMANRYFSLMEPILKEYAIPDDFKYLAVAESGLANVVSPASAVGFWQIREGTGKDYGLEINSEVDERYHLEKSTEAACKYLLESYEKYASWTMTAASYNAGRRGIDRELARQKQDNYFDLLLNEETARYVYRILAFKLIFEDPEAYGFHISKKDLYPEIPYELVEISGSVADFADFAAQHSTNYKLLKFLNPWLRDNKLTNSKGKTYEIKIIRQDFRPGDSDS